MAVFVGGSASRGDSVNYVEYIQSSGTQHINTKFKPNNNTRVVMKFQNTGDADLKYYFGERVGHLNAMYELCTTSSTAFYDGYGNSNLTPAYSNGEYVVDKNKNVTTLNGTTVTHTANTFQSTLEMVIFGLNNAGTIGYFATMRLWYFQIYDNGTLIRDYWPCYDPDGVACLYDKVNEEYVYNAGTGEFIAGEAA